MKKGLNLVLILAIALYLGIGVSEAINFDSQKGTISTSASSEKEVNPDIAEITFAVTTSDSKSLQKAVNENKMIFNSLDSLLKSMINPQNGDYVKTLGYSTTPIYSYLNSKKIFERYEVVNKIVVHTKNVDIIGEMIDKGIDSGATNIDNLSFSLSNYESFCNDLIADAVKKAYSQADTAAKALNTSLDGVSNLNTSCSMNRNNNPRFYMAKNMLADVASESVSGASTQISNGTIKVNAHINASFFVK